MAKVNIMCAGMCGGGNLVQLLNAFKKRQTVRNYEKPESEKNLESYRELKFFEFVIEEKEKDEFLQFLANHAWITENPNFSKISEFIAEKAVGYKQSKLPKSKLNIENRIPVYFVAERVQGK